MFRRKIEDLVKETCVHTDASFFWKNREHTRPAPKESEIADKELEDFLNANIETECLKTVSDTRSSLNRCVDKKYEAALRRDPMLEFDPCEGELRNFVRAKKECIAEHSDVSQDDEDSERRTFICS